MIRPIARPRLYGREDDLGRLRAKLRSGAQIVTLFGPAGIGKTALASELARLEASDGHLVFADLAEVRDGEGACSAVARALGVPLDPRREPSDHLAAVLRAHGRPLVVLDGCDRAVDAVAALLRGWTAANPEAVFLVTSRELLGLTEEHAYEVGPLAVPAPGEHDSDAVTLFLARVGQTRQGELRAVDPEIIADIVRSLEGIPLALELAAGRMSVLSPAELRARLASRLGVLTSRLRTEHPRQQTMRAAIEWSWTLLEPHEQAALRHLSVFRGGFDAEAAEAVVDLSAYGAAAPAVVDVLQSLRAKSFVRGEESGDGLRLGLYEIIRELCEEALRDAGEEANVLARHAAYFVRQAEAWGSTMGSPEESAAHARLTTELDNLLAVQARALEGRTSGGVNDAFRVLANLESVIWTCLPAHASLALLDGALGYGDAPEVSKALRAEVLLRRARTIHLMGRAGARDSAGEALSLARREGSARLEGEALARLGAIDVSEGDARGGSARLREAVALLTKHDLRLAANAQRALGIALHAMFLGYSAVVRQLSGALPEAEERYGRSLTALREQGDRLNEGLIAGAASTLAWTRDEPEQAEARYGVASALLAELSSSSNARLGIALSLHLGHRDLWLHRASLAEETSAGRRAISRPPAGACGTRRRSSTTTTISASPTTSCRMRSRASFRRAPKPARWSWIPRLCGFAWALDRASTSAGGAPCGSSCARWSKSARGRRASRSRCRGSWRAVGRERRCSSRRD